MKRHLLVALGTLAFASAPASAQTMTAAEVESEIIGKTVCVSSPNYDICVRHNADGTSQVISGMPRMSGAWRFEGDRHCITWQGADERCTAFERDGDGYATASGAIAVSD